MAMMRIATTAPMIAGVLSGEEGSVEVISTLGSGFIVEGGSVIEVTLFGVMAVVVGLAVGGGRHSSSFRVYKCKNHSTE